MAGALRTGADRPRGLTRFAAWLLAAAGAGLAGSACAADVEPEIIDPAAAVAATETRAADVVGQPVGGDAQGRQDGSGDDDNGDDEIDPLAIRGDIISEYNLVMGECFNRVEGLQAGRRVVVTARVGCGEPHYAEVFHTFELDVAHPGIYPGDDAMRGFALRECYDHFEPFVGLSYELSVYGIDVITPDRRNFEDAAARYRGVHCWLYHIDDEPLSGSARGTEL